MNPALIVFGAGSFSPKRLIVVTVIAFAIILALPVMAVAAMGTDALTFLAGTPDAKTAQTRGFYMGGDVPGDSYAWGNCTYWAYARRYWAGDPIPTNWGNANTWGDRAKAAGYDVDHTPSVNAVFQTDEGAFGHVAYVIKVDGVSGDWTISEMNAPHLNVVSERTFSKNAAQHYTFIHDKRGATPWIPPLQPSLPSLATGK